MNQQWCIIRELNGNPVSRVTDIIRHLESSHRRQPLGQQTDGRYECQALGQGLGEFLIDVLGDCAPEHRAGNCERHHAQVDRERGYVDQPKLITKGHLIRFTMKKLSKIKMRTNFKLPFLAGCGRLGDVREREESALRKC